MSTWLDEFEQAAVSGVAEISQVEVSTRFGEIDYPLGTAAGTQKGFFASMIDTIFAPHIVINMGGKKVNLT